MELVNSDKKKKMEVPVWAKYQKICNEAEGKNIAFLQMERYEFYDRAKAAYAIVATGEPAPYGNIILKKGVITDDKTED